MPWYFLLLIALAVTIVPFVIGYYLSRALRMPDHAWRIGVVLLALMAGTAVVVLGWPPKYGIDLRGGVILVYDAVPRSDAESNDIDMDKLAAAIAKRVNPGGIKEIVIRAYGTEQIEIIIPEADAEEVRRIEKRISRSGTLEFRIVANRIDHQNIIDQAERSTRREVLSGGKPIARWVPVEPRFVDEFRNNPQYAVRPSPTDPDQSEVLVVLDRYNVTGENLRSVVAGIDERGRNAVNFMFDTRGARLFGRLTGENTPDATTDHRRQLGIILDGRMHNAPNIISAIFERGEISGDFTQEEVEDLVAVLRAGSLPATLSERPVSSQMIDPTLGADTVQKGFRAIVVSMIAVVLFMLIYYRFAGIVACLALALNLVLILAVMITIKAAFTLPGLAGLVLTVGMAVDANVLIYERIREELDRGAALRMAIRNGFGRATRTIVDANLTTLITATVLYAIGTDQVRGFAVTLWLGIVMSMFTAIFCTRVVFDVADRAGFLRRLTMMRIIGGTHIDFIGKRYVAAIASVIVILIGLVAVGARGKNLFGIDFTEGVAIELQFREPLDVAAVRTAVEGQLEDVAVSRLQRTGETPGIRYQINTTDPDIDAVEKRLAEIFGDRLVRNGFTIEQLAMIEPGVKDAPPESQTAPANPATPQAPSEPEHEAPQTPATPGETEQPASGDQSSLDRAAETLLAMADVGADRPPARLAFLQASEAAQQDAPQGEEPASPSESEPAGPTAASTTEPNRPATNEDSPATTTRPVESPAEPPESTLENDGAAADSVFEGGTEAKLSFERAIDAETLASWLDEELQKEGKSYTAASYDVEMIDDGKGNRDRSTEWLVKLALPESDAKLVLDTVEQRLAATPYFPSTVAVGSTVAGDTRLQAIYALLASLLFIMAYIWIRFEKVIYSFAAVIALVHDVLVMLGALAISYYVAPYLGFLLIEPFKIDLPIVAAFLTIVGYSLNDTIVVFDRIREVRGKSPDLTTEMLNISVNQTLSRTLLTALTTLIVVLILYIGGGQGIHGFTFALMVGVVVGTYSSIYVAAPLLLWLRGAPNSQSKSGGRRRRGEAIAETSRT